MEDQKNKGLNTDAVEEMLQNYQEIEFSMNKTKKALQIICNCSHRQRLERKIEEFQRDLDYTMMLLHDEYVLGMPDAQVAADFGLKLDRSERLVVAA